MIHIIADVILFHKCRTHRDVARGAEDEIDEDGEERHVETDHGRQLRQQRVRHACKHGDVSDTWVNITQGMYQIHRST